jgi:hypothetical protein
VAVVVAVVVVDLEVAEVLAAEAVVRVQPQKLVLQ